MSRVGRATAKHAAPTAERADLPELTAKIVRFTSTYRAEAPDAECELRLIRDEANAAIAAYESDLRTRKGLSTSATDTDAGARYDPTANRFYVVWKSTEVGSAASAPKPRFWRYDVGTKASKPV